jgi:hypothetical protein
MPPPSVAILVVDQVRILSLELEREPPVLIHPHGPVPRQIVLERMTERADQMGKCMVRLYETQ